jgi:hypothetical protein
MKPFSAFIALALLGIPTIVVGYSTPPPGKAAPPVVSYQCNDGRAASVIYESGNDYVHAKARVTYDGRTFELEAAPTLYGVRYRGESAEEGMPLAWTLRGEQAWLTESPDADGYTRQERERARCVRLRGGSAEAVGAGDGHGEGHAADHGEDH